MIGDATRKFNSNLVVSSQQELGDQVSGSENDRDETVTKA